MVSKPEEIEIMSELPVNLAICGGFTPVLAKRTENLQSLDKQKASIPSGGLSVGLNGKSADFGATSGFPVIRWERLRCAD